MFGKDFFKIAQLVIGIIRLITQIFGNGTEEEDLENAINGTKNPVKKP